VAHYDPARLDRARLRELFEEFGDARFRASLADLDDPNGGLSFLSQVDEPEDGLDEFASAGLVDGVADIVDVFTRRYFYGCEADDPMMALAFARALHHGRALPAVFASDIGHWDVPDDREVLPEAWELVDDGHLSRDDFRAFCFDHPVALWADTNPAFFDGTAVEAAVRKAG